MAKSSKSVYELMAAAGQFSKKEIIKTGTAPQSVFDLQFTYPNGLIVGYNNTPGNPNFRVIQQPTIAG